MRSRSLSLVALVSLGIAATACAVDLPADTDSSGTKNIGKSSSELEIIASPPTSLVPATGIATPGFKPVDDAIRRLMSERCIGGAVIGISYGGAIVHNRGYGYKDGPPSSTCATPEDPFVGGARIAPDTPFRVGSNSKAVLAAVFRREIKKALSEKRGKPATNWDVEQLKLLDNGELTLVSPKVKEAMLAGGSDGCAVANPWTKVTLGQLLRHRSGLPRSYESPYLHLSALRGLDGANKLAAQEQASGAPLSAKTALKDVRGTNAYFVPRATLEETVAAQGGRCFAFEPGQSKLYSNAGYGVLNYVLEHVTGRPFVAPNGYPTFHALSSLSSFTDDELGFASGIERSHTALGARDPAEPQYRHWSTTQSTYYYTVKDDKRAWCLLGPTGCDFAKFRLEDSRFNWKWEQQRVGFTYETNSESPGAGALAAEAPKYLAFMHRFTVSPPYGMDRTLVDSDLTYEHTGAYNGTRSWVLQAGGTPIKYLVLGTKPDGTWSFDANNARERSCALPKGVDVFFAMNQSADARCGADQDCSVCEDDEYETKKSAYSRYVHILKEALCKVSWSFGPQ